MELGAPEEREAVLVVSLSRHGRVCSGILAEVAQSTEVKCKIAQIEDSVMDMDGSSIGELHTSPQYHTLSLVD